MLSLLRLEMLTRFAQTGSIAATAAAMAYSPAAVSAQLATLERELGVPLLERTARSARLTPAGVRLAARARPLLSDAEALEADLLASAAGVAGDITISTIPSMAGTIARATSDLVLAHPALRVTVLEVDSPDGLTRVRSAHSDIAVVDWGRGTPRPAGASIDVVPLEEDPYVLVCPPHHPLAEGDGPFDLAGLGPWVAREPWLCAPRGAGSRVAGDRLLARVGVEPPRRWEFEGLLTLAELVASGFGLALLPLRSTRALADRIHTRQLSPRRYRTIGLVSRSSSRQHPGVAALLAALIGAFPEDGDGRSSDPAAGGTRTPARGDPSELWS